MLKYAIIQKDKTALIFEGTDIEWALSQGFTEQEVEQSDKNGGWYLKGYAPMKTDEEKTHEEFERRMREIKTELEELDKKRIRAMCEPSEYAKGVSWLEYYNQQARELRAELAEQRHEHEV